MARRIAYELIDDIDQSPIPPGTGETIRFGFQGQRYLIDLSDANAVEFTNTMQKWVDAARPDTADDVSKEPTTAQERRAIRAWAGTRGVKVGSRGQIPHEIVQTYRKQLSE